MVVLGVISVNGTRAQWTISNFFSLSQEADFVIASPFFNIDGDQWLMYVTPNGSKYENQGWLGLTLRTLIILVKENAPSVRLGLAKENGANILKVNAKWVHNPQAFTVDKLIRSDELRSRRDEIAPNGNLVIFCSIFNRRHKKSGICAEVGKLSLGSGHKREASTQTEISGAELSKLTRDKSCRGEASTQTETFDANEAGDTDDTKQEISEIEGSNKVIENYKELLLSGEHSDLTLKLKDKEFKVHRCILGVQSPVFSAMLEHNMVEKTTGIVNIEDNDPETFLDFLRYLYTGRVENLSSNNALSLYTAADKYQVNGLKKECLEYMMDNLSVENFCDIMSLSLRHNETGLTDQAVLFFTENANEIVVTTQWQVFLSENSVTGNELFIKYLSMKKGEKK